MKAAATRHPLARAALAIALAGTSCAAFAQETPTLPSQDRDESRSDKLLLTGGVSQIEGSAGGGLTPWAIIGGYGTDGQFGGNAFYTRVNVGDYHLDDYGVLVGINDRFEISLSQQRFDTEQVGAALGLGEGFTFKQDTLGLKVRVAGDAVLDSDRGLPQIAVGMQYKRNNQGPVLDFIGAKDDSGVDFYVSATKLFLAHGILLNGTVRFTKANHEHIKNRP